MMLFQNTHAQEDAEKKKSKKVKFSGMINFNQNLFSYSGNDSTYVPYRPTSQTIMSASAQLSYGRFSLPFSFSYNLQSRVSDYNTPISNTFRIKDLLNNYNNLSFNPQFKSLQVNLGTQTPKYSELTCGDLPLFGAGFTWKPKKFLFAAHYGMSQRAVNTDLAQGIDGSYQRMSGGAKIGYGSEESSHIFLTALMHKDNENSANVGLPGVYAQQNVVGSLDIRKQLGKKLFVQTEIAASALSSDLNDAKIESDSFEINAPEQLKEIFPPRISSSFGGAANAVIGFNSTFFDLKASAKYYSSDYRSLNYPFLQTDQMQWLIEPSIRLFKSKFTLSGSIGQRVDNLLENKISTSYQDLGAINVNIRLTQNWNISGGYSNFGLRNTITNDTLRIQNVNENINVNSVITLSGKKLTHSFLVSYNSSIFNDFNVVSGAFSDNSTQVYIGTYTLDFGNVPFSMNVSHSYLQNTLFTGDLEINTSSLGANYQFGKNKNLSTGLQGNHITTLLQDFTPDRNISVTVLATWNLWKKFNLGFNVTQNIINYGSQNPGIRYNDNSSRFFANYTF